jgi:two-component system sensor histidine kinase RegB
MLALTLQLHLSGGITNPFVFLYLLQISLCALLLKTRSAWLMVGFNLLCLCGLALFAPPLDLPRDMAQGLASHYVQGLLICFVFNAGLIVLLMTRIQDNLRQRNTRLANLQQQAAQREQIVRMGLLATGAAHELGTPLSTLAVILGDWRHLPQFQKQPDLLEELDQMQGQLARCKRIVTGILLSAGEARGEDAQPGMLLDFLQELAEDWRDSRKVGHFEVEFQLKRDLPLAVDATLKQMIWNVLDNAQEACADAVGFRARSDDHHLRIDITDQGPGFDPTILANIGQPYQSTKGRQGGLGLFLVFNVAHSLGGQVTAANRPEGGAQVTIQLPLNAITISDNTAREFPRS